MAHAQAAMTRDEVTNANWMQYADRIGKIESGFLKAGQTRIDQLKELASRMPVMNVEMFEKNMREPLKVTLKGRGLDDKSIPAIIANTKTALLAMTNGILPPQGTTNLLAWLKDARKALDDNGIVEKSARGRKEGSGKESASTADSVDAAAIIVLPNGEKGTRTDQVAYSLDVLAMRGEVDSDAQFKARRDALDFLTREHFADLIALANELKRALAKAA